MKIGEVYQLSIIDYDMNGRGISKLEGLIFFVEGALKEEIVLAQVTNLHKKYAFAKTIRVLRESPHRKESLCPYSQSCGGCDLLHVDYETECLIKEKKISDTLAKARIVPRKINPLLSSGQEYGYRNKIILPFGKNEQNEVVFGFYQKATHQIVSIDECQIAPKEVSEVLSFIKKYVRVMNLSVYDEQTQQGLLRAVMIRNNFQKEMMVVLVVRKVWKDSFFAEHLTRNFPLVKSVFLNLNPDSTNVILGKEYLHLYGAKTLHEKILDLDFEVSPASFLQVNHSQCEKLYQEAIRLAELSSDQKVIDAYCGIGSITLALAKKCRFVYGIEIVEEAVLNAKTNQQNNQIENVQFICGPCEEQIQKLNQKEKIDLIVFDPPRKGCDQHFLEIVCQMNIPKIVYISCNIATACRDIQYLLQNSYEVMEVTPVDMFPKTSHVESVVQLTHIESAPVKNK